MSSSVDAKQLLHYRHLVRDVRNLTTLPLKKTDLVAAFDALSGDFNLGAEDKKEYTHLNASRLNVMLRHVRQAMCRPKPPAWLYKVVPEAKPNSDHGGDDGGNSGQGDACAHGGDDGGGDDGGNSEKGDGAEGGHVKSKRDDEGMFFFGVVS